MLGRNARRTRGGRIAHVEPGSIGDEIGAEPGDLLVSINGHPLRDMIDYQFYGAEEELTLQILRGGRLHRIQVEREYDESLGLVFAEPLFDGLRQCSNRCPFCFVAQMPRGMRKTLYVRDDDYRLSFLHGSFVTLTNLQEDDWQRIGEQNLSPLYVSVHATDLHVRRALLGNGRAGDIVRQIERLGHMNIRVHTQVVLLPEQNDGPILRQTVLALLEQWPTVQTLAIVPVGLTRYRGNDQRTLKPAEAAAVLDLARELAGTIHGRTGCTWLYPSDEMYLLAGQDVPPAEHYDDRAQSENGVGLVRDLLDDWAYTKNDIKPGLFAGLRVTLVCGELIAPILQSLAGEMSEITGARLTVLPVQNRFFGATVTVSGLLTGADVLAALRSRPAGDMVCLPKAMLDETGERTLDDMSIGSLAESLGVPVEAVSSLGEIVDLLYSLGA
ncbi:MAG: DUF512 domain-containing protein [Chloroflexi bacterium]|nr:DUF512 domain-containing protein [Chloroflexota bacterium]